MYMTVLKTAIRVLNKASKSFLVKISIESKELYYKQILVNQLQRKFLIFWSESIQNGPKDIFNRKSQFPFFAFIRCMCDLAVSEKWGS